MAAEGLAVAVFSLHALVRLHAARQVAIGRTAPVIEPRGTQLMVTF